MAMIINAAAWVLCLVVGVLLFGDFIHTEQSLRKGQKEEEGGSHDGGLALHGALLGAEHQVPGEDHGVGVHQGQEQHDEHEKGGNELELDAVFDFSVKDVHTGPVSVGGSGEDQSLKK